jgi:hypothetical protein
VPGGGGAVVSLHRIGPLVMDRSDQAAVLAYAGPPEQIQYMDRLGNRLPSATGAKWETLGYDVSDHGLRGTFYSLWLSGARWALETFSTTNPRWRTPAGTRVGMSYRQASQRERVPFQGGCLFSGLRHYQLRPRYFDFGVDIRQGPGGRITSGHVDALFADGPHELFC